MSTLHKLTIASKSEGFTALYLDGVELKCVKSYELKQSAPKYASLSLELTVELPTMEESEKCYVFHPYTAEQVADMICKSFREQGIKIGKVVGA